MGSERKNAKYIYLDVNEEALSKAYSFLERASVNNVPKDQSSVYKYIDRYQCEHSWAITFKDDKILPETTEVRCWWCKMQHQHKPLGCPIEYVPNRIVTKISSPDKLDSYEIRDLEYDQFPKLEENERFVKNDYYVSRGSFCSFNCVLAYILENPKQYPNSTKYLYDIHYRTYGNRGKIIPSMDWTLLKEYGGFIEKDDFHKDNSIRFVGTGTTFKPAREAYEKIVTF